MLPNQTVLFRLSQRSNTPLDMPITCTLAFIMPPSVCDWGNLSRESSDFQHSTHLHLSAGDSFTFRQLRDEAQLISQKVWCQVVVITHTPRSPGVKFAHINQKFSGASLGEGIKIERVS